MPGENYRHIFLEGFHSESGFTSPRGGGKPRIPNRNRATHSEYLRGRLTAAWEEAENRQAVAHMDRKGVYLDFISDAGADLVLKSLEARRSGIRLLNVHKGETEEEETRATVYIPNRKRGYFLRRIAKYAEETTAAGNPKNMPLVNSIGDIRLSFLESFWQDEIGLLPEDGPEWVEVWLSSDEQEVATSFVRLLEERGIERAEGELVFPERRVLLIEANRPQLDELIRASDDIAELRRGKELASVVLELENQQQLERVRELLNRTHVGDEANVSVCILDTGVNRTHLLIEPFLAPDDCHAVNPAWGTQDQNGHGTKMAGVAVYGDLMEALGSTNEVHVGHLLESSKILPPHPATTAPKLWGYMTSQGVSRAEIQAPYRQRVVCMAVTSTDSRDHGRPSSWSARVDELASGVGDGVKRLLVIAAGNLGDSREWLRYPDSNRTSEVHDPGQSWNALVVGAYTEKVTLQDPTLHGYYPVAPHGGLSPFSTTSLAWQRKWPIKPDVTLEGGNAAAGPNNSIIDSDDLAVLSLCHETAVAQFVPFNMTSAASAQAAWMAARIQAEYPQAWPETVRGLVVHSAEWTDAMKAEFLANNSKGAYHNLLRVCGYGVPRLEEALHCASNSLTLVSQAELQPYDKKDDGHLVTRDMHLYNLPWPKEVLEEMQDTEVQMRITLSYFVEPGPGEVGWQDRYRYPSHGLRFSVKAPTESQDEFVLRVNAQAREEGERPETTGPADKWTIGSMSRHVGSIHSDIWCGTAAELAESHQIAIYPTIGWWRERAYLGNWDNSCRYSLIVSVRTPPDSADIYIPVAAQIGIEITT